MTKNFKHHVRITLDEELSKHDVVGILSTVSKSLTDVFESSDEGTAVIYHSDDEKHSYDFRMNRSLTEAEAEVILELIQQWTDNDFDLEVTTTEDYFLPENEYETDISAIKHNRWVDTKVQEGWRYGLEFSEEHKTDPRMRPYHELTEKLKNM